MVVATTGTDQDGNVQEQDKRGEGMITFLIGLAILAVGGLVYGKVCEKVFKTMTALTLFP